MSLKRILVVDDDDHLRYALSLALRMSDFEVEMASNGREALDKVLNSIEGERPYDLLITDIIMPEMNGLELVERLNRAGIGIPVLVISAYARDEGISDSLPCKGVAYFLEKPFNMQELIRLVDTLSQYTPSGNETDEREINILVVDDCEDIRLLMESLLRAEGYEKIDFVENGREALEKIMATEKTGERYSLMITDLEMPGMGGLELIRSVQDRKYEVPILAISGKEEAGLGRSLMRNGARGFLRKPVDFRDFNETVRRILLLPAKGGRKNEFRNG